jgi:hypothetical protein
MCITAAECWQARQSGSSRHVGASCRAALPCIMQAHITDKLGKQACTCQLQYCHAVHSKDWAFAINMYTLAAGLHCSVCDCKHTSMLNQHVHASYNALHCKGLYGKGTQSSLLGNHIRICMTATVLSYVAFHMLANKHDKHT